MDLLCKYSILDPGVFTAMGWFDIRTQITNQNTAFSLKSQLADLTVSYYGVLISDFRHYVVKSGYSLLHL